MDNDSLSSLGHGKRQTVVSLDDHLLLPCRYVGLSVPLFQEKQCSRGCVDVMLSEHQEQVLLFGWLEIKAKIYPFLGWAFAIPNGELRKKTVAIRLKAEGVKSGVPDTFFPVPCDGYHGLWIEMKRSDKEKNTTKNQKDWIQYLRAAGYRAEVAAGWVPAVHIIIDYFGLPERKPNL